MGSTQTGMNFAALKMMRPMRLLVVHNVYQHRGGEDAVVESEIVLLRARGHVVETYTRNNHEISGMSSLATFKQTLWSSRTTQEITTLISHFQPDVIHAHNTFPLVSPSLYWAATRAGVPVVQTLHNYRLLCLNGLFLREGGVCNDCQGRFPWRGVVHKCYRSSGAASAVVAGLSLLHRGLGTYHNKVARYIALNDFSRNKFIEGGLPAERIVVKPNFVDLALPEALPRHGLLFVGRLSVEKGIGTLVSAAEVIPNDSLRIAGSGPDSGLLEGVKGITLLGNLTGEAVRLEMNRASALVLPSIWYENFPRTIVEAFATGLPVIASRIGALADLVRDGETGLLFEPGNALDLANKMAWALAHPDAMANMGREARAQYEAEFTADRNYEQLMEIYEGAISTNQ